MSRYTDLTLWYETLDKPNYRTRKGVEWEIGTEGSGLWLRVPIGFEFDVSVPWIFRLWFRPSDVRFLKASCLHDYALATLGWDRVSSAAAFSEALKASGVPRLTRLAMVLGVISWRWR